jgi:glycosyltransferase involved in cell wall biosynthesis
MEHVLDGARVVVVPSRWPEPFGMVGIEAMRRGRPVVAAGHGGILDWLVDGVTGWTFRPGDASSLASVLTHAMHHPRYEAVAREASARAATHYGFERMLDQVEGLLLGLDGARW